MSLAGIVGDHKGSVAREVLITLEEWEQMKRLMEEESDESDDVLFEAEPSSEPAEPSEVDAPEEADDASLPAR
jgi:hypothetical protein